MRVEVDSGGHAVSVRGVMVDVTARKLAEQRSDQYLNLVEHLDVALFVFGLKDIDDDSSLSVLAVNPEGAELLGTTAGGCASGGGSRTCSPLRTRSPPSSSTKRWPT